MSKDTNDDAAVQNAQHEVDAALDTFMAQPEQHPGMVLAELAYASEVVANEIGEQGLAELATTHAALEQAFALEEAIADDGKAGDLRGQLSELE